MKSRKNKNMALTTLPFKIMTAAQRYDLSARRSSQFVLILVASAVALEKECLRTSQWRGKCSAQMSFCLECKPPSVREV